nr:MAG TPA: hypothetical protein [Caudoviricetes sp.]
MTRCGKKCGKRNGATTGRSHTGKRRRRLYGRKLGLH